MESTETRDWPQKNGSNSIDGHGVQSTSVPSSAVDSSDPAEQPLNNNGDRNDNGTGCCTVPKLGSPRPSSPAENGESANCTLMRSNSRPSTDDGNLLSPNTSRSSMSQSQSPTHHHLSPSHRSAPPDSLCSLEELDEVGAFFEEHSAAIERWFRERAPNDVVAKLQSITAGDTSKSPKSPHRASVTSDLFQQWLASSPVKKCRSPTSRSSISNRSHLADLDEGELFMELIRDVANELDIDVLCHKILVNVGLLTHADRGSLFLVNGPPSGKYLVAKLFDVTQNTPLDEAVRRAKQDEIIIPFGVGIAGTVAQTNETINIKEAYKDPRFNSEIDQKTGYKTNIILSMPICNYEGQVIGVAQIINKTNGSPEFTERDVEIFRRYLTFCGIGIQNAQLFEMSVQEYRRNQILLNLARSIFSEQNNLECLVTKIMTEARELLKCERCAVFLLDLDCGEANHLERILERPERTHQTVSRRTSHNVDVEDVLQQQNTISTRFTMIFELGSSHQSSANILRPSVSDLNSSMLAQIAEYVAATGETLNISDVLEWLKDKSICQRQTVVQQAPAADGTVATTDSFDETHSVKSILCMPIINGQKTVIGVAQLINKQNDLQFTNCDISIFEAFAIFCGLGIHNTQMYESACKLMAKQKVALECLSYHATASQDQTLKLVNDTIQSAEEYKLYSFKFIDFDLDDDDTCRAAVRMFLQCNLVQQFHIPYDVLCRWILSVRKNYRPVKYHNWRHALNVAQTMFAMMKTGKMERFMTDLEILGLLVACLCHDLDHRGTNNAFQSKTDSPLAILYTTSTMEHHHFDQCVMILNSEGNNIFQALSPEDFRTVMKVVETAILSTDLAMYFKKRNQFLELIENGEFDWQSEEKKEILCGMMMTACDVSAIAKPWEVQHRVAKLVADEFFDQGDLEKLQLNQQPVAMMDRERKDELPKMQVGFIDVICLPLYKVLTEAFPWISPLYEGTMDNRQHWHDLAEKVEMGLTWIDHDTIDKPVEEFAAGKEPLADIEFTVTTLNCAHPEDKTETTPVHERKPRFSSLRKTGALGKAVRNKLSKSVHHNAPATGSERPSSIVSQPGSTKSGTDDGMPTPVGGDHPVVAAGLETKDHGTDQHHEQAMSHSVPVTPASGMPPTPVQDGPATQPPKHPTKPVKKRSKLCMLL
ncbi:cGMP-specific 3',5'-cyclic phosphodiesterase [Anopheles arabiensis]|uniref:Phosphodiesterase n=1 Tax=Anopheles arabiensis TaxID=7173 RepID=A0A453YJS4_ANOAR|nr:cGMP-specific 3',5'-cyclic phosphodiesterase [Anopheles arabiensis]XP_040152061.1 cGMP-specific 3',5'-cyclic phosphodiesterase [Anopheles arabiensis]XP_040152062.1 cGMP-specific 3',5'-cyclic phosphodiesterase [Anopheles arabiensis]XP_040152063.1 cGMP-specific 3',5'-cyclic phosphodiesterase [Anopheles arabiensis]XP_040152064.1 cGMP-specific 3',5'-cyclic phosphodiesterase [Anopheles arabiensis]XP_040152065.1 cGMP-specific 3',5'-cyclic phosphodiesterase [Anopheles arabiensis]XP_040152066.1 cG